MLLYEIIIIFALVLIFTGAFFYYRSKNYKHQMISNNQYKNAFAKTSNKVFIHNYYLVSITLISVIYGNIDNTEYRYVYLFFLIINTAIYINEIIKSERY
jgi:hypothetical protein